MGVVHQSIMRTEDFLYKYRFAFFFMSLLVSCAFIPSSSYATTSQTVMPWQAGTTALLNEFTGSLPRIGATIAIACAAIMWTMGESQITKVAIRVAIGSAIALSAPDMLTILTGAAAGCVF